MNYFRGGSDAPPQAARSEPAQSSRVTSQPTAAPPLDEGSIRALLDRLAFVERPVDVSQPMSNLQMTPARPFQGIKEPSVGNPNAFWFRTNLRGNLGALNTTEINSSEHYQMPLAAILDPLILQYYAMNGAYQFQIVKVECELNFVPNDGASGMIFLTAVAQSEARTTIVSNFNQSQNFTLDPPPMAYPIDQNLDSIFATFDVDVRDARTVGMPIANAAAWLSVNTLVRFDGVQPPPLDQNKKKNEQIPETKKFSSG